MQPLSPAVPSHAVPSHGASAPTPLSPAAGDNVGPPPIVVVMGPAGCGKTTVGQELALRLGVPFADADAFHTPLAIERMSQGVALRDEDREPWLEALAQLLSESEHAEGKRAGLVLACSALKAKYRTRLQVGEPFQRRLAYLAVPAEVLRARLAARADHFAGPALLDSQLATLEVPVDAETFDGTSSPDVLALEMMRRMRLEPRR